MLPLAADKGLYVAARLRDDGRLRLASLDQPQIVEIDASQIGTTRDPSHGWGSYPIGVFREFAAATGHARGVEMVFAGDLPMASGLSSSAAIEVVTAFALNALHGTGLSGKQLAMLGHRAENDYVGLRCGIMDQFASALGRPGHVLWLHCHTQSFEHVPLDAAALDILVLDTRKARELAASGFNQRVRECAEAFAVLTECIGPQPFLAAYTPEDVERARTRMSPTIHRRARHVATEMQRVTIAATALRGGDLARLGAALDASHASARDDYEVSCAELDVITAAAREVDGVFGARLTGAGFGGCAIALVAPGRTEDVAAHVGRKFVAAFGVEPRFDVLRPGPGPCEI